MSGWVRFDPTAVRAAFDGAGRALVDITAGIAAGWDDPGLGEWTVRDLAGHASRALLTVGAYLDAGRGQPVALHHPFDYFTQMPKGHANPAAINERARQAGLALGEDPAASIAALYADISARVSATADDAPVATPAGVMGLVDYLPCRIYELTVHGADLAAATVQPADVPADALLVASLLSATLAASSARGVDVLLALNGRRPLPAGFSAI